MATSYEDAIATLYRAPLEAFVAERKRLAASLKAQGDRMEAAQLTKLPRPSVSAWAVNQLFWRERQAFDALMSAAEQLRAGSRDATSAHREALARLRPLAIALLEEAGHTAAEATLRRVTTTLSALAVAGGFAPDPPGALSVDREAPGFAALEGMLEAGPAPHQAGARDAHGGSTDEELELAAAHEQAEAARREAAERERKRADELRARRQAERERLEGQLRAARSDGEARNREVQRLRAELGEAERELRKATDRVQELEAELAQLQTS